MEEGWRGRSAVAGRRGPLGRRLERVTALVPLLLTGVRHLIRPGGPTRSSADAAAPRGFPPRVLRPVAVAVRLNTNTLERAL